MCDSQDDKILKTCDYFQNININIVFLLNTLSYIQNLVKYLHCKRYRFYVLISQKLNLIYSAMRYLILNFEN